MKTLDPIPPRPEPPCTRDCPSRSATCHAECEAYKAHEKRKIEWLKLKNERFRSDLNYSDFHFDAVHKTKKRSGVDRRR